MSLKIGQRDSKGRLWTQKRQDAIQKAWTARHNGTGKTRRSSEFKMVRSNSVNAAVMEYQRSVRRVRRARARLMDVLQYMEKNS